MPPADHRPVHVPVMPREVLQWLQLTPGLTVLDGTVGAGGHSQLILKSLGDTGQLIGLDRDPMMLAIAGQKLQHEQNTNCQLLRSSYADAAERSAVNWASTVSIECCWILGCRRINCPIANEDSVSMQVVRWTCDFIRMKVDRLRNYCELLMKNNWKTSFARMVKNLRPQRLLLKLSDDDDWGNQSRRRKNWNPVCAMQLELLVTAGGRNPATRVFQALRIATNDELQHVERMLTEVLPNDHESRRNRSHPDVSIRWKTELLKMRSKDTRDGRF